VSRSSIRAAVVGTGFAAASHLDALSRIGTVEVAGILGSEPERTREGAKRLGVDRAYRSLDEVVSDPGVDVVHVCTPNHTHAHITSAALDAGKHVVSEKPLGLDLREATELMAMAERTNAVSAVCFNYRHFPLIQELRGMLAAGTEGPAHLVHGSYLQDWLLEETDWNWRVDRAMAGAARAMGDIGSHWVDLLQHVTGDRVSGVCARLSRLHDERVRPAGGAVQTFEKSKGGERVAIDTEDMATILFRFAGGAIGTCVISQVSPGRKNHLWFEIDTARASFTWDQEEPNVLRIGRRSGGSQTIPRDPAQLSAAAAPLAHFPAGHQEGWPDALHNLMLDVYAAVGARRRGEPYEATFATFADAEQVSRVVEAVVTSDAAGRWTDVQTPSMEATT
jgi:predicted dehydrogenase